MCRPVNAEKRKILKEYLDFCKSKKIKGKCSAAPEKATTSDWEDICKKLRTAERWQQTEVNTTQSLSSDQAAS